ncbi:MAG: hypothetical protein QXO70_03605 [Candidatus Pacearchaeota archaeon]
MKIKLKLRKKAFKIEAKECRGIQKLIGLMFSRQKNAVARIFKFKKPTKITIHSLFCPNFLAIWLKNKQIPAYTFVKTTRIFIKPSSEFDCLVEIPINKKYENITKHFV